MGQFSWLYSDTGRQMVDDLYKDSYLLVPPRFQDKYGKYIIEKCYDGYGNMGDYDVYDLIAIWNRLYIPVMIELINSNDWKCGEFISKEKLQHYYDTGELIEGLELRDIGIQLSCYDEDNARLPYPIKITERPLDYNSVAPSKGDPNQGWEYDDEDEDDEEEDW